VIDDLVYDNLLIGDERLYHNTYAYLAFAAANTDEIGLGTGVTNPYTRHPALTTSAIATIDELLGGRAMLGLGAGSPIVLDPLGYERSHLDGQRRRQDDQNDAVRRPRRLVTHDRMGSNS